MKLDTLPREQLKPGWFQGFQVRHRPYLIIQRKTSFPDTISLLGSREWVVLESRLGELEELRIHPRRVMVVGCKISHVRRMLSEHLQHIAGETAK